VGVIAPSVGFALFRTRKPSSRGDAHPIVTIPAAPGRISLRGGFECERMLVDASSKTLGVPRVLDQLAVARRREHAHAAPSSNVLRASLRNGCAPPIAGWVPGRRRSHPVRYRGGVRLFVGI
jgi:hypothetical protein